jgi:AraC family transcriptional regulator of adaptative response/methylated-DNA-[protein]-cysteine methyltransferase
MEPISLRFTLSDNHIEFESINYGMPATVSYGTYLTPFGLCCIVHSKNIILHLSFCEPLAEQKHLREVQVLFPESTFEHDEASAQKLCHPIFSHQENHVPLCGILRGSEFQINVWKQLLQIPQGTTCSYQNVAHQLHIPRATRAVAHAIARNNIAYVIPCHRVMGADGKLRGYRWGIERKKLMLQHESLVR